ncbi:tetratricopeptide repeat protein [Pseudomonas sp. A1230]|uniref:Sel1 repeat family protein n=1 Tax=Pseudomonas shahriarae TaxID=2745512 RepID=A0A9X4H8C3_9PSED|nr:MULTISPECIES: sel1 repeat family protein [Pseudomonas]MDD1005895.1 sel1 repeat family protein [Pseudomonas shahriarae]CEL27777.1 Sel1 repeat protein [Pseudomonas fluorescens]
MIKQVIFGFLFSTFFSFLYAAQLTDSQTAAKNKGITLYQQSAWDSSQPFLKIAAEAGDQKAQYYLGEAIRLSNRYTTEEARKWYEAAADQGDLYAMLRLSSKSDLCNAMGDCATKSNEEWRARAIKIARERADEGDTEAMVVMFTANQGLEWLEKAAESKDSFAQQLLASAYQRGQGWFIVPGSREKAIEKWFKASAEAGFPPGMYLYANYLYEHNGDMSEIGSWLRKTAEAGHIDALVSYALNVAHIPDTYGFPLDLVKAYGFTYLVSELKGGGASPREARINLPQIAEKMNAEEIEMGISFAKKWEQTHPPLSYFPPIYGY